MRSAHENKNFQCNFDACLYFQSTVFYGILFSNMKQLPSLFYRVGHIPGYKLLPKGNTLNNSFLIYILGQDF